MCVIPPPTSTPRHCHADAHAVIGCAAHNLDKRRTHPSRPRSRTQSVAQATKLVMMGPRRWPTRSRITRPSPCWTSRVRAAALFTPPHCHADAHVVIRRAANHLSTCRMRLHAPMTVSSLRVAGNCVGDDGATALAAALKENATLTTLNLGCACRGTFHPATLPRRCTCGD